MGWWMLGAALAASPWKDADADVVAIGRTQATAAQVTALAADLARYAAWIPEPCAEGWTVGAPSAGVGATGRVTWTPGFLHRRLDVQVVAAVEGRYVELEHLGRKGFTMRALVTPAADGATVELHAWFANPPWPFRAIYHENVKPEWEACFAEAIRRIDGLVGPPAAP